jgi:RNA polymerase sigma-70 factor (ECF subfamily)
MTSPAVRTPNSAELVRLIRSGDPAALSAAYFEFAPRLITLADRLLGSMADAEDVVQDLFVALPEALEQYQERGKFSSWLNRTLVRLALMRLRGQRRRRETGLDAESITQPSATGLAPLDLEPALRSLSDDDRTIVVLKAIEGYSHDEIAELLGIRPNTSAVRYHRALERLRSALEA